MASSVIVMALVAGCGIFIAGLVLVAVGLAANRRPPSS